MLQSAASATFGRTVPSASDFFSSPRESRGTTQRTAAATGAGAAGLQARQPAISFRLETTGTGKPSRAPAVFIPTVDDSPPSPAPLSTWAANSPSSRAASPTHSESMSRLRRQQQSQALGASHSVSVADLLRGVRKDRATATRRRVTLRSAAFAVLMLVRVERACAAMRRQRLARQALESAANQRSGSRTGSPGSRRGSARRRRSIVLQSTNVGDVTDSCRASARGSPDGPAAGSSAASPRTAPEPRRAASPTTLCGDNDADMDDDSSVCSGEFTELTPPLELAENAVSGAHDAPAAAAHARERRNKPRPRVRFPAYAQLTGLPPETRDAIQVQAAEVLRRAVCRYRMRLQAARKHREHRIFLPTPRHPEVCAAFNAKIRAAAAASPLLSAVPADMLEELVHRQRTGESLHVGDALLYQWEPPTHVVFLIDGSVQLNRRMPPLRRFGKGLQIGANADQTAARTLSAPLFLRETSVYVEAVLDDINTFAVHCFSAGATIVRIPSHQLAQAIASAVAHATAGLNLRTVIRLLRAAYVQRSEPLGAHHLRKTPLLQHLNDAAAELVLEACHPVSFLAGASIIERREQQRKGKGNRRRSLSHISAAAAQELSVSSPTPGSPTASMPADSPMSVGAAASGDVLASAVYEGPLDFETLIIVVRGELVGSMPYYANGAKQNLVFARWKRGAHLGEKAVYFAEPYIYSVSATKHADCYVLPRAKLLTLLQLHRSVRTAIAEGALAIRCGDPSVALRLEAVRAIPWVRAAMMAGVLSEAQVKDLFALFQFRIFPVNELITSASRRCDELLVLMTGTAIAAFNTGEPAVVPATRALGCYGVLLCTRWLYPTVAVTECEGWVLSQHTLLDFCARQEQLAPSAVDDDDERTPRLTLFDRLAALAQQCFLDAHQARRRSQLARIRAARVPSRTRAAARDDDCGSSTLDLSGTGAAHGAVTFSNHPTSAQSNPHASILTVMEEEVPLDDPPEGPILPPQQPHRYDNGAHYALLRSTHAVRPLPRVGAAGGASSAYATSRDLQSKSREVRVQRAVEIVDSEEAERRKLREGRAAVRINVNGAEDAPALRTFLSSDDMSRSHRIARWAHFGNFDRRPAIMSAPQDLALALDESRTLSRRGPMESSVKARLLTRRGSEGEGTVANLSFDSLSRKTHSVADLMSRKASSLADRIQKHKKVYRSGGSVDASAATDPDVEQQLTHELGQTWDAGDGGRVTAFLRRFRTPTTNYSSLPHAGAPPRRGLSATSPTPPEDLHHILRAKSPTVIFGTQRAVSAGASRDRPGTATASLDVAALASHLHESGRPPALRRPASSCGLSRLAGAQAYFRTTQAAGAGPTDRPSTSGAPGTSVLQQVGSLMRRATSAVSARRAATSGIRQTHSLRPPTPVRTSTSSGS
jgi:CRP-like cAMP-binding protein